MSDNSHGDDQPPTEVYRRSAEAPVWYRENSDGVSPIQLLSVLLRHRWKVLGPPVAIAVLAVAAVVLWPASYTSEASIMSNTEGGVGGQFSQFSGVASQFGIEVPRGAPGQSPQFYADLLTSARLLEEAVTTQYRRAPAEASPEGELGAADANAPPPAPTDSGSSTSRSRTLVELYEIQAPSRAASIAAATSRLEDAVSVNATAETGLVNLSVSTPWPEVSRQAANRLIELVNRFNNSVRQSQASAEAQFVEERLQEVRHELRTAEDSLQEFLQRNVGWQQSPELRFQHDRLQRRVSLKQQVHTSLATRYEEARISEVKSTPVVTTVTEPRTPVRPDQMSIPLVTLFGLALGGVVGLFWAFGAEFTRDLREEESDDYREFVSLREEAAEDVMEAARRLKRLMRGRADGQSG